MIKKENRVDVGEKALKHLWRTRMFGILFEEKDTYNG